MATYDLSGRNNRNDPDLVRLLKTWLNAVGAASPRAQLNVDTPFDRTDRLTDAALRTFQQRRNITADGICRIRTWQALCREINRQARPELINLPKRRWVDHLLNDRLVIEAGISVEEELFFVMYAAEFSGIIDEQRAGLRRLLGFIRDDEQMHNLQWAAYVLATTKRESGHTFEPIDEGGKGAGHEYGKEKEIECGDTTYKGKFYGRGYVQITWGDKYKEMGELLGYGCELVRDPERVKDPQIAYRIMSVGMREGRFRSSRAVKRNGKVVKRSEPYTLARFINYDGFDYYEARNVVNGAYDAATEIAGYAHTFEAMLRACNMNT